MKNVRTRKRVISFIMVAVLLGCSMMLGACGSGEKEYKVTVKDSLGNACGSGVIVTFYQNDEQVAMQACGEDGTAVKKLAAGDYTVKLQFTDGDDAYYYEQENLTLSKDKTELEITLIKKVAGESLDVFAGGEAHVAYFVETGDTYVEVEAGKRAYFVFMPREAGTYEFSIAEGDGCSIAYYGSEFYVHNEPARDVVDGKTTMSIKESAITSDVENTTRLVLGVDSEELTNCIISIKRIGDAEWHVSDEDWIIYQKTVELSKYTLPEGTKLKNFDLTADTYNLVYNEKDGFYHLDSEDGPLVYAYLTKNPRYVDCFKTILESGTVRCYFYDDDGKFIKKVAYGQCLKEYFEYVDAEEGVYPLTKDLKHIIQSYGEQSGWWDPSSKGFMICNSDGTPVANLNTENGWLFMCCYAQ